MAAPDPVPRTLGSGQPKQSSQKVRKKKASATELGFAMDPLNMGDWKTLREQVETTEFSSLEEPKPRSKSRKKLTN
ncbi:MAG TPA: hypothetical protein VM598_06465 [Bdellovibrionota bacterium]|nr:hypothetical protein [Bdellovibrionota bacterium]